MPSAHSPANGPFDRRHSPSPRPGHKAEDEELLRQLDAAADRIQAHIPDEPYILTIPQDEPKYHHYSRHLADAWLVNSPFTQREDYQVQYQSFVYREPYSDLFERVRYSHFDRVSKPTTLAAAIAPSRSVTNTPTVGPKKKISLAAYKNKQAQPPSSALGSTPAPTDKDQRRQDSSTSAPDPQKQKDTGSLAKAERASVGKTGATDHTARPATQNELKRKYNNTARAPSDHPDTKSTDSRKRVALSPPTVAGAQESTTRQGQSLARHAKETKKAATIPRERLSPIGHLYLPGRLSPTLPSVVVAALDEGLHALPHPSTSDASAGADALPKATLPRPVSKHDSVLSHATSETTYDIARAPVASLKRDSHVPDDDAEKSLVVVLKIPKKDRSNFRRLVQFNPRASKESKMQAANESPEEAMHTGKPAKKSIRTEGGKRVPEDKDEAVKGVARKISVSTRPTGANRHPDTDVSHASAPASVSASASVPASASKRPREPSQDSLQPDAKRPKLPPPLKLEKDPSTPLQPEFRSPALPQSAMKSQQATPTPRKERTSIPMKRVESADSMVNTTPSINSRTPSSRPATSTLNQPQRGAANTRPSPLANSARTPESQAWSAEHTRLGALAKELKHAAVLPVHHGEPSTKSKNAAEAATLASVESFLCFVLSFYCADKSWSCRRPSQVPGTENWTSCHAYFRAVLARCQDYPHLAGLTAYLGTAYNGVIMRRIASGKPDPATMQEAVSGALKTADEATAKLPLSVLKSDFPQTWKRGKFSSPSGEAQVVKPGQYEGAFSLAIGIQTDPLEAARFAHALLTEFCAKGDSNYKMRLKLSA